MTAIYSQEERAAIAQEILAYMKTGEVETTDVKRDVLVVRTIKADAYHRGILEATALDVLGQIDLGQQPPRIRKMTRAQIIR